MSANTALWYQVKQVTLRQAYEEKVCEGAIYPWDFKRGVYQLQSIDGQVLEFEENQVLDIQDATCDENLKRDLTQWLYHKKIENKQRQRLDEETERLKELEARQKSWLQQLLKQNQSSALTQFANHFQRHFQLNGMGIPIQMTSNGFCFAFQQYQIGIETVDTATNPKLFGLSVSHQWLVKDHVTSRDYEFISPNGDLSDDYIKMTSAQLILNQIKQVTGCWALNPQTTESWTLKVENHQLLAIHHVHYQQPSQPMTPNLAVQLADWVLQLN